MRLRAVSLVAVLMAGSWLACGDDYQETGPLTGDTGAKCFPDGTCKAGLLCLSNLCVAPPDSGTTTSSSSGGPSDAGDSGSGTEDSGDAGADSGCGDVDTTGVFSGVVCDNGLRCAQDAVCCSAANAWACRTNVLDCSAQGDYLNCDSPGDCPSDQRCCFAVERHATRCAYGQVSSGICMAQCPVDGFALCDPSHACAPPAQCTDRTLLLQGGERLFRRGLCERP